MVKISYNVSIRMVDGGNFPYQCFSREISVDKRMGDTETMEAIVKDLSTNTYLVDKTYDELLNNPDFIELNVYGVEYHEYVNAEFNVVGPAWKPRNGLA